MKLSYATEPYFDKENDEEYLRLVFLPEGCAFEDESPFSLFIGGEYNCEVLNFDANSAELDYALQPCVHHDVDECWDYLEAITDVLWTGKIPKNYKEIIDSLVELEGLYEPV